MLHTWVLQTGRPLCVRGRLCVFACVCVRVWRLICISKWETSTDAYAHTQTVTVGRKDACFFFVMVLTDSRHWTRLRYSVISLCTTSFLCCFVAASKWDQYLCAKGSKCPSRLEESSLDTHARTHTHCYTYTHRDLVSWCFKPSQPHRDSC